MKEKMEKLDLGIDKVEKVHETAYKKVKYIACLDDGLRKKLLNSK